MDICLSSCILSTSKKFESFISLQCEIQINRKTQLYPSPFPPPHTILRKAQNSHMTNLYTSMVLSLAVLNETIPKSIRFVQNRT